VLRGKEKVTFFLRAAKSKSEELPCDWPRGKKGKDEKCDLREDAQEGGDTDNVITLSKKASGEKTNSREPLITKLPAAVFLGVDRAMSYDTFYLLKLHFKRLGVIEMVDL